MLDCSVQVETSKFGIVTICSENSEGPLKIGCCLNTLLQEYAENSKPTSLPQFIFYGPKNLFSPTSYTCEPMKKFQAHTVMARIEINKNGATEHANDDFTAEEIQQEVKIPHMFAVNTQDHTHLKEVVTDFFHRSTSVELIRILELTENQTYINTALRR